MDDELYINSAKERIKDQLATDTDEVYPQTDTKIFSDYGKLFQDYISIQTMTECLKFFIQFDVSYTGISVLSLGS